MTAAVPRKKSTRAKPKTQRLPAGERRRKIVEAALPLFARKGPDATTTREIAAAAGVSEPILYRHFASKDDLYRAIQTYCSAKNAAGASMMLAITPGSYGLVLLAYATVVSIYDSPNPERRKDSRMLTRLAAYSLLGDGRLAGALGEQCFGPAVAPWLVHAGAAEAAGELVPGPIQGEAGAWLGYLLSMAIGLYALPARKTLPLLAEDKHRIAVQATWFILRGLGMRDEVVARHLDVEAFRNALREV